MVMLRAIAHDKESRAKMAARREHAAIARAPPHAATAGN
jgi:hypothetical protein